MSKPKVIAIVGPTASGKSSLGVFLAQKLHGEVISADSRQVYKGLDIGTGKITKKEMQGIPHHLLSVVSAKKQFTVDGFVKLGHRACFGVLQNTKIPIVAGGTGLYVDMLLGRMSYPNVPPDASLRVELEKKSVAQLFAMLKKLDPARAKTIEPKHKRRLIRALEIAKSPTQLTVTPSAPKYSVLWLGLNPGEKIVKQNIHIRLVMRMQAGMVKEARALHARGLSYKRMEELGLEQRFLARLLQKKISEQECMEQLEREIHKYAKRQMRWFKRNSDIHWVKNKTQALQLAKKFLSS